jgi:hypothetical protein
MVASAHTPDNMHDTPRNNSIPPEMHQTTPCSTSNLPHIHLCLLHIHTTTHNNIGYNYRYVHPVTPPPSINKQSTKYEFHKVYSKKYSTAVH